MRLLIAGQGSLPGMLAAHVDSVAALEGFAPDDLEVAQTFRIERLGSFIACLADAGVHEVCFAGAIQRPPLDPGAVDAATMPLVPRMLTALQSGDDAALRLVISFFEEAGMKVVAAHVILPDLIPPKGLLVGRQPPDEDISRGFAVLAHLGSADVGQACVVHKGQVIAMEGQFGTDWMLDSLARRPDDGGGLLVKAPKPDQDRRIDIPAIGPETVRRAKAAQLDGIAIAADVMILDRAATVAAAEAAQMSLLVHAP